MVYMKFKKSLIFLLILACSCSVTHKSTEKPIAKKNTPYFISVPLSKFSVIQSPCVEIEIEGRKFSAELDLGFRGDLTFTTETMNLISSKYFIREKPMYGIRGKEYTTKLYQIPKLQIGKMTFLEPVLQEGAKEFTRDSTFVQNGGEPSPREPGRLGWEIFSNVNLLIDIKNSRIAFCDSIDTLKTNGYEIEKFTKTPLFLERGLVELDVETSKGNLRCMLDTGATWNILNCDTEEKSIDEAIWEQDNILEYHNFNISGKNFGPVDFHRMPIKIPIHIVAILGMEFFQHNLVFLDFNRKSAYFLRNLNEE